MEFVVNLVQRCGNVPGANLLPFFDIMVYNLRLVRLYLSARSKMQSTDTISDCDTYYIRNNNLNEVGGIFI